MLENKHAMKQSSNSTKNIEQIGIILHRPTIIDPPDAATINSVLCLLPQNICAYEIIIFICD